MATPREPAPDPDLLPVPVDTDESTPAPAIETVDPRLYIEIRPSERRLDHYAVQQAMEHLLSFLQTHTATGWLKRRRGTERRPVVEWTIVADGRPDTSIRYLVSTNYVDLLEDLEGILRTCFPNSYEFEFVEWHPLYVEEFLPFSPAATTEHDDRHGPNHPAITPEFPYVAGLEYRAVGKRRRDWQTPLRSFTDLTGPSPEPGEGRGGSPRVPLSAVTEAMVDAECPVIYQVILRPYHDWTSRGDQYIDAMERGKIGLLNNLLPASDDYRVSAADHRRIDAILDRDPTRTFAVSARAAVLTRENPPRANAVAQRLSTALGNLSGPFHEIVPRVVTDDDRYDGRGAPPGSKIFDHIRFYSSYYPNYEYPLNWLPGRSRSSRGIVAAVDEVPGFCLIDGAGLPPASRRALSTRAVERAGLPLPPPAYLARFSPPGQAVGMPLTHDRLPYGRALYLHPDDQDRHVIVVGPTGSGKSILTEYAALTNVEATAGPEIILDLKGGGTSMEYLQSHLSRYGSLDDVIYFDCTQYLPALSVLDIGPLLDAGVPREEARSRIAGHFEEMLASLMGDERYYRAVEAPKAIRNHLRALFDPVNGTDAVSVSNLFHALARTQRDEAPPPVSDDRLADYFASLLDRDRDVFNRIMGGALNRVETVMTDGRLAPMFDHQPRSSGPSFDFADVINDQKVVIFDFGGMEDNAKRAITLALASNLWRALQARTASAAPGEDHPLVNLYLEEASAIGDSDLLDTLLSQGRSFGLSLMLGVQFLGQLDSPDPESRTYEEALNDTATIIAGQVATRDDLVHALATESMVPAEVDRRLSRMPRGEWLIRPGTAFGVDAVPPFLMESLPAPPGHPASEDQLNAEGRTVLAREFEAIRTTTREAHGLGHDGPESLPPTAADDDPDPVASSDRIDVTYLHSKRMPPTVEYDPEAHALICLLCDNLYDPDIQGMKRAIECHSALDAVDRDDIPIGPLNVKRSAEERAAEPLSAHQFMALQAFHLAPRDRFDPLEYDLTRDSMIRIEEYVGIEPDELQALLDEGYLVKDGDHPHRLYSVTAKGRRAIGENVREGVDYGDGKGDLGESAQHRLGVILGVRYLEQQYADDPDSPVVAVKEYYDVGGNSRIDAVGLDANGEITVTLEVERINHDWRAAIPEDFDKMAACEPTRAIWIAMSRSDAHRILEALNEPPEGPPRIEKTYQPSTAPQDFVIDSPGLTDVFTIEYVRDRLEE